MFAQHVVVSSAGRVTLYEDEAELLEIVRAVARISRGRVPAFCVVDEHVHLLAVPGQGGLVARDLRFAVRRVVRPALESWVKDVRERAHCLTLVSYILRQPEKHGLNVHPAVWAGSCFQDLVGARVLPGFDGMAVFRLLPRLRPLELNRAVGLDGAGVAAATLDQVARGGVGELVNAGAGAIGRPSLRGKIPDRVAARVAVLTLAAQAGVRQTDVIAAAGVSRTAASRLAARIPDERLIMAIRRQWTLRRLGAGWPLRRTDPSQARGSPTGIGT